MDVVYSTIRGVPQGIGGATQDPGVVKKRLLVFVR